MPDPQSSAASYGIAIELADLGDWGSAALFSEYDAGGPVIRVNARALERYREHCGSLSSCDVRSFIDLAVAHELYHHREAIGEIPRLSSHRLREAAADAYARANVAIDARLAAFVTRAAHR